MVEKKYDMILVTDVTDIWIKPKKSYTTFVKNFLKKWKAKRETTWSNYSKLARVGKITYNEALRLWLKDCGIKNVERARKEFRKMEEEKLKKLLSFNNKEELERLISIFIE